MTIFNPDNKQTLTYGEALSPAMEITEKDDAIQYKAAYMKYIERFLKNGVNESGQTAEEIVNENIGYYAGYYGNEIRKRVEELFNCKHPVFGAVKDNGIPTGKEAFACGESGKTLEEVRSASEVL